MKLKIGLIFLTFCVIKSNGQGSDTVAEFRAAIDYRFTRFQAFYDATNNAMNIYRLGHVDNIHSFYQGIMREFGHAIETLRSRGGVVPSVNSNHDINACAVRANNTLHQALTVNFYPTFTEVQAETSKIPLLTINGLSRGNVFDNNQEILDYLLSQYDVKVMQWLRTVSQLFRWEKTRVEVYGAFYNEEMNLCLGDAIEVPA